MKTLFLILFITPFLIGQNLYFTPGTCVSQDSITIDLGFDTELIQSEYGNTQQEARAIAFARRGTWTNDSLQVYAAVDPDSTYYPVYVIDYDHVGGAILTLVGSTGSDYFVFDREHFAGIRYLMFVMPANEAGTRIYTIVRRRY